MQLRGTCPVLQKLEVLGPFPDGTPGSVGEGGQETPSSGRLSDRSSTKSGPLSLGTGGISTPSSSYMLDA